MWKGVLQSGAQRLVAIFHPFYWFMSLIFICILLHKGWLWNTPSLLGSEFQVVLFPPCKSLGYKTDLSPLASADIKNIWSFAYICEYSQSIVLKHRDTYIVIFLYHDQLLRLLVKFCLILLDWSEPKLHFPTLLNVEQQCQFPKEKPDKYDPPFWVPCVQRIYIKYLLTLSLTRSMRANEMMYNLQNIFDINWNIIWN